MSLLWLGGASVEQPERASRLMGAAMALQGAYAAPLLPPDRPTAERLIAETRARLDPAAFDAAWAEGQAMSLEEAAAYALKEDIS